MSEMPWLAPLVLMESMIMLSNRVWLSDTAVPVVVVMASWRVVIFEMPPEPVRPVLAPVLRFNPQTVVLPDRVIVPVSVGLAVAVGSVTGYVGMVRPGDGGDARGGALARSHTGRSVV